MTDNEIISKRVVDTLKKHPSIPGDKSSIVSDFHTILDYIGESGLPVSGRVKQFKSGDLNRLNDLLKFPVKVSFVRPTYHSFPNILGLYGLLLYMEMVSFKEIKVKNHILLNREQCRHWKNMTEAEKYIALFTVWIKKGSSGKIRGIWQDLFKLIGDGAYIIKQDPTRENAILRNPGMDQLSLMGMFGLIKITQAEPELVETWVPISIAKTTFGEELLAAV